MTSNFIDIINKALDLLLQGDIVGIPTETVYGLAADAANPHAVSKIFSAKGRPAEHPLIVHIAGKECLTDWAADIPDQAWRLADTFWPGPLTLVLKRLPTVSDVVTGGLNTVGLRVPSHSLTLELLKRFGGGLAAPSANRFGHISPTTAAHVRNEFNPSILKLVLDGGACQIGIESTIIGLYGDHPILLRPGGIAPEVIEDCLGTSLIRGKTGAVRVSGSLDSHYAPRTPLIVEPMNVLLAKISCFLERNKSFALLTLGPPPPLLLPDIAVSHRVIEPMPDSPDAFAYQLYATLRRLDKLGFDSIFMESPPTLPEWIAVNDRLCRAAYKRS